MSPDDRWRVLHMIEAAEQALAFVHERKRTDLEDDPMLRLALTRAIEIVGGRRPSERDWSRRAVRRSLAADYRHAQSSGACLFRHQSRHPVGHVIALPALLNPLKTSIAAE